MDFKFIYCNKCDGPVEHLELLLDTYGHVVCEEKCHCGGRIRIATLSIPDKVYQPTKCTDCGAPVFAELNGTGYCLACYREHTSQVED